MGKTVLVTGSAKSIGRAIILEFSKKGYNVIINYLTSQKQALELKKEVEEKYNVKALIVKADITNEKEVIEMKNYIKKEFGKLDVLVNNAVYECDNNYLNKTKDEFMKTLEVNVVGTFLVTKYLTSIMNSGIVINISSTDSVDTYSALSLDYSASKAGVNSLVQTFSISIPNIKFISLLLPWVNTESTREMFYEYLKNELKRTNQKRLMDEVEVAKEVYRYCIDEKIKSGSIVRIELKD